MIVKYADGKPRRTPRRSITFAYEFDGFHSSEEFLVIELSGSFDCVFRHQPDIDWLTGTVRPRDIDVNAVLAFLCGTPNQWPHVAVMDPDSMTHAAREVSDGPSCAVCEYATCAGPEQESQDTSDVVEHGFPRPDEQRFSEEDDDDDVIEHGFPRPDEQWLSPEEDDDDVVEHGFPRVVDRELPKEVDVADQLAPRLGADVEFRHPESADVIEHGFSLSAVEDTPRPVRRRGRRKPRQLRAPSQDPVETESEVISVLVGNNADELPRACNVEVARPPCYAAEITRLPGLSWKHFLRDLKIGRDRTSVHDRRRRRCIHRSRRDPRIGLNVRRSHTSERCSSSAIRSPVVVPAALPPDRGVRHEIDLVPGAKYSVTRQWPLPRDQVEAIDAFFEGRRQAGHVRESLSPHSSPTFCVKKASGGCRIVHAFNTLNNATITAQTPIQRKDMVLDTMSGSTKFSAIDLMDGFYQILMREADVPLTAVSTPSRMLWEWLVMPQGLQNALPLSIA
ncbi:hypothetical protein PR002_g6042 [Phytophthora rubi]|uniref:Reverse transcriptase domain-containing protein n=1 Tax=Phytophthora rubi TaxID=129364 RepID=A0A6A3NDK9_9STRA|nr:hypothetical protein PR002_g6042 [Phytophthora rubi]